MPLFPGPGRDDDARLTDAIHADGVLAALPVAAAYGPWLYDYAHALLRDRDWASDALRTVLLEFCAGRPEPDPEDLRGLLYTALRAECLDRLAGPGGPPPGGAAADAVTEAGTDPVRLERGRVLVEAALGPLNGLEREVADLTLRHRLTDAELAAVLEIPPDQATELAREVQNDIAWALTMSLGRLILRADLPTVLDVLPFAVLPEEVHDRLRTAVAPIAESRQAAWRGRGPLAPPPAFGRREKERPEPEPEVDARVRSRRMKALTVTAAASGVLVGVAAVWVLVPVASGHHQGRTPVEAGAPAGQQQATAAAQQSDVPVPGDPAASATPSAAPSGTATSPATGAAPSTPAADPSSPGTGTSRTSRTKAPAATVPAATAPVATAGSLAVDDGGCQNVIAAALVGHCTVTLSAHGGAVHWAVTSVSASTARMSAAGSGTLAAGESTGVRVTVAATVGCYAFGFGRGSVAFSPGGVAGVRYTCW